MKDERTAQNESEKRDTVNDDVLLKQATGQEEVVEASKAWKGHPVCCWADEKHRRGKQGEYYREEGNIMLERV